MRDADNWTSGNEVNVGALIVGNNPSSTAYNAEANVTIENSEFIGSETTPAIYVNVNNRTDYGTELTIGGENTKVGTFAKNTSAQAEASITILGGTFSDPDAIGSYVVEGMKVDENGKVVIDTDEAVAEVNGVDYTTLPAAVEAANANDTITLLKDVELESEFVLRKAIVLDGANHKITYKGSNTTDHLLELLASATVKNVTLDSNNKAKGVNTYANDRSLKITFENVTMVNSAGNGLTAKGGEVTLKKVSISGSTWTQSVDISSSSGLQNGATLKVDDQCTFSDVIAIVIDNPSENEVATVEPLDETKLKITSSDETKQWNAAEDAYTKRIFTITKVTSTPSTGGYVPTTPTTQKPVIEPNADVTTTLSTDGTTLTIKANDGYEITDVTVNGVSKGAVTTLTGLKTGDKVVVTAKKIETPDDNAALIEAVKSVKLVARSAMSKAQGKTAVKITWYATDGSDVELDGVEIFRSTKRYSGYGTTPIFTTAIKKGTKYYYKVRGYKIIDGEKVYTDWSTKAWRTVK